MGASDKGRRLTIHACAKVNLTLRLLGVRPDGYHSLRTTLQSLALYDTLIFQPSRGAFAIECDDPDCPSDRTNLVWRAADEVWRAAGRRGVPGGVRVRIAKRIPVRSGLGGGSSDAAAAIRGLTALWRLNLAPDRMRSIASSLGADVPFFLEGGTSLGVERGDLLFPLIDQPPFWVVLAIPGFGISTKDAYTWWDLAQSGGVGQNTRKDSNRRKPVRGMEAGSLPDAELRNDLEQVVSGRHPDIGRLVRLLGRAGALHAAMSGSGSSVFGLFDSRRRAEAAGKAVGSHARQVLVTRTLSRSKYRVATRIR